MAKLYDISDNLLSRTVQVMPDEDGIVIVNRLLNGSHDLQTIGDPASQFDIRFHCPYAQMNTIKAAWAAGTNVKIAHEGVTSTCIIITKPRFSISARGIAANRWYNGSMTIEVIS